MQTSKTFDEAMGIFEKKYNLWHGKNHLAGIYTSLVIESIQAEIYIWSAPLYASFGTYPSGHVVVIRGFYIPNSGSKTMSYMDPKTGGYKASIVPASGAVTIIHSGNTLNFSRASGIYN